MDYKEKYESALGRARIWKDKSGMPKDRQGILDDIFSELKESEDERIRKELIRAFQSLNTIKVWNGIERIDIIAWLEKQENKPQGKKALEAAREEKVNNTNKFEPKFKVGNTIKYVGERKELAADKYTIKEICNDCYITTCGSKIPFRMQEYYVIVNDTKGLKKIETSLPSFDEQQGTPVIVHNKEHCQNTAWSEEDKIIMSAISQLLKDCESENCWNCVYSNDREVFFVDIEKWLKSLKDRFSIHQNNLSEDDEVNYRILQTIICNSDVSSTLANRLSGWLQSIKQRKT